MIEHWFAFVESKTFFVILHRPAHVACWPAGIFQAKAMR
jgi:hypothetical protein